MARPQDTVSVFGEKKGLAHVFGHFSPFFFICIIFKKESPGVTGETGGDLVTAGAPLSNLQLVPGRENIGDVSRSVDIQTSFT